MCKKDLKDLGAEMVVQGLLVICLSHVERHVPAWAGESVCVCETLAPSSAVIQWHVTYSYCCTVIQIIDCSV